jgi:hypothetical protein
MDQKINRQAGDVQGQMAGQQQQALDRMAMSGGVSAGARERMMNQGVGQGLQAQQNIFSNRLGADFADEQNRQGSLQNLGQAEQAAGAFQGNIDSQNIGSAKSELFQKRAFDTNVYNEQMRAWAAERTAAATPSSGGGKK